MRMSLLTAAAVVTAVPLLAACTENAGPTASGDARSLTVASTDDACQVSTGTAPAGTLTFNVTNSGKDVTEFYVLGEDGLSIVGEVENIGPNLTKKLVLNAPAGAYFTACKPGMKGDGIKAPFTVSEASDAPVVSASDAELIKKAEDNYGAYVRNESAELLDGTKQFVAAYKAGDKDDEARALYASTRTHWERIETVAESFGDLDPKMDAREADLNPGDKWTGWHRIEKDLWPARAEKYKALTPKERAVFADDLLANTVVLDKRIRATGADKITYQVDAIANGSRGLLEEVAVGKVTGEEEYWSRTDLWDFQANVDGARVGFEGVKPILETKDPELAQQLTERFAALQALLDTHKVGDGFKYYDQLTKDEVKQLKDGVDALSEPLSHLTAALVG